MFNQNINTMRGIAIFLIVFQHFSEFSGGVNSYFMGLLSGATYLFVFISGYLFYSVFYPKFVYRRFVVEKVKNVVLPYLFLVVPPLFYIMTKGQVSPYFESSGVELFLDYLFTGRALVAYWYIPFVFLVFLMSPLHVWFIRRSLVVQLFIIFSLSLIAAVVQRPVLNINIFQALIYYTPVYLFGMFVSKYNAWFSKIFDYRFVPLLMLVMVLSLAYYQYISLGLESYRRYMFEGYSGFDVNYFQKMFLALLLLYFVCRIRFKAFDALAKYSFAIFFIHPYVLWIAGKLVRRYSEFYSIGFWLLIVVGAISVCIAVAYLMKYFLGKRSRYIIGY